MPLFLHTCYRQECDKSFFSVFFQQAYLRINRMNLYYLLPMPRSVIPSEAEGSIKPPSAPADSASPHYEQFA